MGKHTGRNLRDGFATKKANKRERRLREREGRRRNKEGKKHRQRRKMVGKKNRHKRAEAISGTKEKKKNDGEKEQQGIRKERKQGKKDTSGHNTPGTKKLSSSGVSHQEKRVTCRHTIA